MDVEQPDVQATREDAKLELSESGEVIDTSICLDPVAISSVGEKKKKKKKRRRKNLVYSSVPDFPLCVSVDTISSGASRGNCVYGRLGLVAEHRPDTNEIRRGFHQEALKAHPDKGGDAEVMVEVMAAKTILMDKVLKAEYDETRGVEDRAGRQPPSYEDL